MREHQDAASAKTGKLDVKKQCLVPRPERGVGRGTFFTPLAGGSLSVLGSTPCFFREPAVVGHSRKHRATSSESLSPLPINADHWQATVAALELSPQQARVTELMLRGMCDKQIASELGISESTLRTYMARISARTRTRGRMELAMRVWAIAREVEDSARCHHK